jgi:hypothetical protein
MIPLRCKAIEYTSQDIANLLFQVYAHEFLRIILNSFENRKTTRNLIFSIEYFFTRINDLVSKKI